MEQKCNSFCSLQSPLTQFNLSLIEEQVRHIVSSKKFLRISSSPHYTLPKDNYDAPEEVCGKEMSPETNF